MLPRLPPFVALVLLGGLLGAASATARTVIRRPAPPRTIEEVQIGELRRLLGHVEGGERARVLLRLSDLFWARQGRSEPETRAFRSQSAAILERLLEDHPHWEGRHEARLELAERLGGLGRLERAEIHLKQVSREGSGTDGVVDGWVGLGDAAFERTNLDLAQRSYLEAIEAAGDNDQAAAYAQYKLGWSVFRQARFDDARMRMQSAYELARASQSDLARWALHDVKRVYASSDDPSQAWDWFSATLDQNQALRQLTELAEILGEQGRFRAQMKVEQRWLEVAPARHPDRMVHRVRVLEAAGAAAPELLREQAERLASRARRPSWVDEVVIPSAAEERAEEALFELAADQHRAAQKLKRELRDGKHPAIVSLLTAAEALYRAYLAEHPFGERATNVHFYRAEVLWDLERFVSAAGAYTRVLDAGPDHKYARDAAFNTILALGRARRAARSGEPSPYHGHIEELDELHLTAMQTYLDVLPVIDAGSAAGRSQRSAIAERVNVRLALARELHKAGSTQAALRQHLMNLRENPAVADTKTAATEAMQIAGDDENWPVLAEVAQVAIGLPDTKPGSSFVRKAEAAATLARLGNLAVDQRQAEQRGDLDHVLEAAEPFVTITPPSPPVTRLLPEVLLRSIRAADALGRVEEATELRQSFAERLPRHERAPDLLLDAALQRWQSAQPRRVIQLSRENTRLRRPQVERAARLLRVYLERYPDHGRVDEALALAKKVVAATR